MADSTLVAIRTKIRRLTRSPSEAQITDTQIDEYVNTFIQYDFPEHLRLFSLRTVLTFYTEPYVDVYETNTTNPDDPLFNFKNRYITVHEPLFIAGFQQFFTQSREQFFGIYPMVNSIQSIGTAGDGVTTLFAGTLANVPIITNNVLFSSVDTNNAGLAIIDSPTVPFDGTGDLIIEATTTVVGTINYITGAFSFTFPTAPAAGQAINSQTVPYVPALPQSVLYYHNKFTLRPIPDQPYRVDLEAYIRPTELLANNESPELEQWWQYIAYGAARKIFQDRMDTDSLVQIEPEFKKQEALVTRRTIVQYTNERVATIYTEQTAGLNSWWWGSSGSNF